MKRKLVYKLLGGIGLPIVGVSTGVLIAAKNRKSPKKTKENFTKEKTIPTILPSANGEWKEAKSDDDDEESDHDSKHSIVEAKDEGWHVVTEDISDAPQQKESSSLLVHKVGDEDNYMELDEWYNEEVKKMRTKARKWRKKSGYDSGDLGIVEHRDQVPDVLEAVNMMHALGTIDDSHIREILTTIYVFYAFEYTSRDSINDITKMISNVTHIGVYTSSDGKVSMVETIPYSTLIDNGPLKYSPYKGDVRPYTAALNKFIEERLYIRDGQLILSLIPRKFSLTRRNFILFPNSLSINEWVHEVTLDSDIFAKKMCCELKMDSSEFYEEVAPYMEVREAMLLLSKVRDYFTRKILISTYIDWAFITPSRIYRKKVMDRIRHEAEQCDNNLKDFILPVMLNGRLKKSPVYDESEQIERVASRIQYNMKFKDWYNKEMKFIEEYKAEYEILHPTRLPENNQEGKPYRYPSPSEIAPVMRALANIENDEKRMKLAKLYKFHAFDYPCERKFSEISNMIYFFENKWYKKKHPEEDPHHTELYWSNGRKLSTKPIESANMDLYDINLGAKMHQFYPNRMNPMFAGRISADRRKYIESPDSLTFGIWANECTMDMRASIKEFDSDYQFTNNASREMPMHSLSGMIIESLAEIKNFSIRTKLTELYIHWAFAVPISKFAGVVSCRIQHEINQQTPVIINLSTPLMDSAWKLPAELERFQYTATNHTGSPIINCWQFTAPEKSEDISYNGVRNEEDNEDDD